MGALREPEEDSGEVILAPLEGCDGTKDQDDDVQISKVHDKHPWDVEHANRVLKRTKASYAAHISDLKTDLAATKAMVRLSAYRTTSPLTEPEPRTHQTDP